MAVRIENRAEPIPGYRLMERIGGGGFGEVWKAEAPGGLHKAIKFVYGDLQTTGDEGMRAEQELKALSRVKTVRHPYILSLERFDIVDGQLMIVMELADRNLWDRFRECRAQGLTGIPREELLGYMDESAEALDLMNSEYQLQHLDIKPQNIFLVHNHIKVADFGLVKDLEGMVASVTGGVTPVYAAPETFDGWVSRFSDQYSLAIVYQELLTGKRPFAGSNVRQLVLQHLQGIPDLSSLIPTDRPIIAVALAKDPNQRHSSCKDMVDALRLSGKQPDQPPPADSSRHRADEASSDGHMTLLSTESQRAREAGDAASASAAADAALVVSGEDQGPATRWIRPSDEPAAEVAKAPAPREAPPEVTGDGVLFPALIVSLGQLGLDILQQLRQRLGERVGSLETLPNIRVLHIDTDAAAVREAIHGNHGQALAPGETLLARLNRPSHYLKPRDGRSCIGPWFNPKLLYRIPRTQVSTGLRALGRLAFCDSYPAIARRLDTELQACADVNALAAAARQTQLGMRTNRPRVYILTSLTGGTGSGMFIDLAYVARSVLKKLGYDEPHVTGMFLLPAADRNPNQALGLSNAFAALTELNHFASPRTTFTGRYAENEAAISDPAPPFNRCFLLPLPEGRDEGATQEVAGTAGDFLYRELCTPLGRVADMCRAGLPSDVEGHDITGQTFGLYRFTWPRRLLVRAAAQDLCRRLIERWMSKDAAPLREMVQVWVQEQWQQQQLGTDVFLGRLQAACEQALGQAPETAFAAVLAPSIGAPSDDNTDGAAAAVTLTSQSVTAALQQLAKLVGEPGESQDQVTPLIAALRESCNSLVAEWGQKLAVLVVQLIEQPEFRLAGAEEAVRQIVASLEQTLQHHEAQGKELTTRAADALKRIPLLLASYEKNQSAGARKSTAAASAAAADLLDLLRFYPRWRYQGLVLQELTRGYLSLRGQLSDQAREVNFCRVRLGELLSSFDEGPGGSGQGVGAHGGGSSPGQLPAAQPADAAQSRPGARGRCLFPQGCRSLDQAIAEFMKNVQPSELQELDERMQKMIQEQFTALVHVCLVATNIQKKLAAAMQQDAEAFVGGRMNTTNAAELFLQQYADDQQVRDEIANAFEEAVPELAPSERSTEVRILALPAGAAGNQIRDLAAEALPDVEIAEAASDNDMVIYREAPSLPLADLDLLGPLGYEAYRQMAATQHLNPHSRCDIAEWRAVNK